MLLEERDKVLFVTWLTQQAETCDGLVEQLKNVPGPAMDTFIKREKVKAASCRLIIHELKDSETMASISECFRQHRHSSK